MSIQEYGAVKSMPEKNELRKDPLEQFTTSGKNITYQPHVIYKPQLSYWSKVYMGLKLILGADIYTRLCSSFSAAFSSKKEFMGLEYNNSTYDLVVSLGPPKTHDIGTLTENHEPVTQVKVTRVVDSKGKPI